jgi:hypothetical protein
MTRSGWLVAAGVSAFLVFLIGGIPAAALRWLVPEPVRMSGTSGTLWRGSASSADVGKMHFAYTRWALSPLGLLLGRLGGDLETSIGEGKAAGAIVVTLGGDMRCTACRYEGPLASLRSAVPALRTLDGRISIEMAAFEISNKWPTRAVGSATLTNVPIGIYGQARRDGPVAALAATVTADPVPDSGLIDVAVQDSGGPLELSAQLSISPPGNYELSGRVKARPGAPPDLVNALNILGPRAADGSTEIALSGTF